MDEGTTTVTTDRVTNVEIAELLGISHVQVYRLRVGDRLPSIETMQMIERELGWSFQEQGDARAANDYPARFEAAITRYASTRNTTAGPETESQTPQ